VRLATENPYSVELFDDRGNLLRVLGRYESLVGAKEAYAQELKMPRRAAHILMLCLKAQILRRSDRPEP